MKPRQPNDQDAKPLHRKVEEYRRWFRTLDRQVRLLERERQKFSALVNYADAGFILVDSAGKVVWANQVAAESFTDASSWASLPGMRCSQILCCRKEACESCPAAEPFRTGTVSHHEIRLERDGQVRYLYATGMPVKSTDGKIEECIIMLQDVSDLQILRQSQEAVRASEERFRSIFENVAAGMVTSAANGSFLQANPAFCRMVGYTEAELLEMNVSDVTHPHDLERTRQLRDEILSGRRPFIEVEKRYVRKNGQTVWGRTTAVYLQGTDSQPGHTVAVVQDITQRKRAERELKQTQAQYEGLVNSIDGIVWEADPRTFQFSFVSKQAERILGYPTESWAQDPNFWMDHIHPDDRDYAVDYCSRTTAQKRDHVFECRMIAADGNVVWLRNLVTVIVENDEPVLLRGIMVDITDRKDAEAALRQREEQLRESQKMEAIGRLAGGIAHDFNNLLTAITGHAQLLANRLDSVSPLRRDVERIAEASRRAASLTGQLLAFSRRQVLQAELLDLNAVVCEVESMFRRVIGEDIELVTALDPGLGATKADPGQLQQVLANLAVNARDAMPDGGRLTIETAHVHLDSGTASRRGNLKPGPYIVLRVSDTGCGMDENVRSRIFEPFFTTKQRGKGTGLGLSTAYGIIRQTGGHIEVRSDPGKGSTFTIHLPRVSDERPPAARTEADQEETPVGSETVLLAEDDEAVRCLTQEILEMHGYKVHEAADGIDAVSISAAHPEPIDLLLTDVVMPRKGGIDLARELGASRPSMKVLYMSGYTEGAITPDEMNRKGAAFLQKPFTPEELARKVRELLDD